jgi:hypothetical protein
LRLLKFLIAIILIALTNVVAQQTAQVSIKFEVYDDAGGYKDLYFGLDETATDGIDIQLGESDLPPYPPSGSFDARWLLPENNFNGSLSSWSDYRFAPGFPYSDTKEHRVRYQSAAGATKMIFSWNFPPEITGLLQDLSNGAIVNVPLSGSGIYELTNFVVIDRLKLLVYYNNVVTVIDNKDSRRLNYNLEQNYPNPFNPVTTIKFCLAEEAEVNLSIYNLLGQIVTELVNTNLEAGNYSYQWDAGNVASGIFLYVLKTAKFVSVKKLVLLK